METPEREPQLGQSPLDILADEAFEHVAGMELADVMRSQRYQEHLKRYTELFQPESGTSLQQIARQYGVHHFGAMMSIHMDDVVAFSNSELAKAVDSEDMPTPHEAAVVATLNDAMLDRAATLMGPIARSVANRWGEYQTTGQQYYALWEVYQSFSNKYWKDNNPDSDIEVELLDEFDRVIYDGREPFFPQNKPWPLMEKPNCLGMSLLMTAFAREAGANFVYVNQITAKGHILHELEGDQGFVMEQALQDGDMTPSENVDWYTYATTMNYTEAYTIPDDFHHSIAIQLSDGKWIQMDPYMGTFGRFRFDDKDRMDDLDMLMPYYWESMPGLTAVNSVRAGIEGVFSQTEKFGEKMGDKANELAYMYADIDIDTLTVKDFTRILLEAYVHTTEGLDEDYRGFLGPHAQFTGWINDVFHVDSSVHEGETRDEAASRLVAEVEVAEERFSRDRAYRRRRLQDLITMPITIHRGLAVDFKIDLLGRDMREPGVEVANPNYMPALMTLNHLRSWSEYGNNTQSVRLVAHSSTQLLWHEAHQTDAEVDAEILDRAERALRVMPMHWMHDRVRLLLISREKPEKGAPQDEEQEEGSAPGESVGRDPEARESRKESGRDPA